MLYLILIHHQTTTVPCLPSHGCRLYLILIHHQTTTEDVLQRPLQCCISSLFITKPQRYGGGPSAFDVVSHPYSSPNHNKVFPILCPHMVVSHPYSSPNHNTYCKRLNAFEVVSHPYSSPNHNYMLLLLKKPLVVSHPYSSPNHNLYSPIHLYRAIYIQI